MYEGAVEVSEMLALLRGLGLESWEVWVEGHRMGEAPGRDSDREASAASF